MLGLESARAPSGPDSRHPERLTGQEAEGDGAPEHLAAPFAVRSVNLDGHPIILLLQALDGSNELERMGGTLELPYYFALGVDDGESRSTDFQ